MKKQPTRLRRLLAVVNFPMYVCKHVFGKHHTHAHRITVGTVIMVAGVLLSKCFADIVVLHILCDLTGYLIHGLGAVPIIDYFAEQAEAA